MKSKDMQKVVLSKYEKADGTTKIFQDLNGTIRSNDGADESMKAALSIYPNHLVVQESFKPREQLKS